MERYTEKHYDGNGYYLICSGNCETFNCGDCGILDKIVDRLAAYEDMGLEPEEIAKIREDAENGYMKSTARRYGIPVDRLRELAEADREGRIRIEARAYQCPKCGAYRLVPRMDNQFYYCFHCKTQLTRAEAEEALRREQDG